METTHTPEPWCICTTEPAEIRTHPYDGICIGHTIPNAYNAARIVAAVNACAGMADPAKEIAEIAQLREKVNSLEFRLSQEKHLNTDHEQDYLAVWKLIKRPDETVVQAAQRLKTENEAMREAIQFADQLLYADGYEIDNIARAKLQAHLPAK